MEGYSQFKDLLDYTTQFLRYSKSLEKESTEDAFRFLISVKDNVPGSLFDTFHYKAQIYEAMANIGLKENKGDVYFNFSLNSIICQVCKGLVDFPSLHSTLNVFRLIDEKNDFYFHHPYFDEELKKHFKDVDGLKKFIHFFFDEYALKFLYPKSNLIFSSLASLLNYDIKENIIINADLMMEVQTFQDSLPVFETVSNISALFGYQLSNIKQKHV